MNEDKEKETFPAGEAEEDGAAVWDGDDVQPDGDADGGADDDTGEDEVAGEGRTDMSERFARLTEPGQSKYRLSGMYRDWYLDYASYVILERAVPHIEDGLKPVQRRILHAMRKMDDGRYNKVANVIGQTMQYHPHGDASIGDALVQLGQKELLIDKQGNWGNILTGDEAAAPRYIEARLSKFALEVVFNPKTTEWMLSYDGRNQEPVTLPVKFPLLLAQGVEGIAVGLASKILPHNFNELIDASIAALRGRDFTLYPDFQTGGLIDVSRYNDGLRGGVVRVRARISKGNEKRTLEITEIPYGTTTESLKESIVKAVEKGKIKARSVDDYTAEHVKLIVHVSADESVDKVIDALYAFTDCEVSISPNSCVIYDDKPHFLGVSEILRRSAERTKQLLGMELRIRLDELDEEWHKISLERIFIENKVYEVIEGKTREEAYDAVAARLEPFRGVLRRDITRDDVVRLTELQFIRISRYDSVRADNQIKAIEEETASVRHHLDNLTDYAVEWYEHIKEKYGKGHERQTEIRTFDSIDAAKVVVANSKLYVDRAGGFFGIGNAMKKDEYVCDCSDMDEVIAFTRSGNYIVTKVADKYFYAKDIIYIGVFKRNDERTIYNVLYRDGEQGPVMMKRCAIKGITRDREYTITKGTPGSRILYMSVNPNGEAEVLKIMFRQRTRLKKAIVDLDFSKLAIKGRNSQGNLFSRYAIHKIQVKERGVSTLAGQNIWYDEDVNRLNNEGRGRLLGEFAGNDRIVVFTSKGKYYTTGYDLGHHFPEDTIRVEKYSPERIYSVAYYDGESRYYYLKRFMAENDDKLQSFVDDSIPGSRMVAMSEDMFPQLEVTYDGAHAMRPADKVDVARFIGVKSHRAKGKRITTYDVAELRFVEPLSPAAESGGDDSADGMQPDGADVEAAAPGQAGSGGVESGPENTAPGSVTAAGGDIAVEESVDEQGTDTAQLDLF